MKLPIRSAFAISTLIVGVAGCSAMGIRPPWFPTGTALVG